MSEFEKELENVKYSDFDLRGSKCYSCYELIEHFKDWQPPKPLVEVPQIVARHIETEKDNDHDRIGTLVYGHYKAIDEFKYSELDEWIANNFDTFLEAIVNGYTVKKEVYVLKHIDLSKNDQEKDWYLAKKITGKLYHSCGEKGRGYKGMMKGQYFTQSEIDELHTSSYEQISVKFDEVE